MASRARLSYNNVVKRGTTPKINRPSPDTLAQHQTAQRTQIKPEQPKDVVDTNWTQEQQNTTANWYEPHKPTNWEYSGWVDGPKELIIYWQQGVDDALHGKEPAKMAAFFDQLERGLLPSQQCEKPDIAEEAVDNDWWEPKFDAGAWGVQEPSPADATPEDVPVPSKEEQVNDLWDAYGTQVYHRSFFRTNDAVKSEETADEDGWLRVSPRRKPRPHKDLRAEDAERSRGLKQPSRRRNPK